jgi:hypothetical protein
MLIENSGDQATPTCGRCAASGNECIRGFTYRFHRGMSSCAGDIDLILIF